MLVHFNQVLRASSSPFTSKTLIDTLSIKGNLKKFQCANAIIVKELAQHGLKEELRVLEEMREGIAMDYVMCYLAEKPLEIIK